MNDLSPNPFSGHGGERDAPRSQALECRPWGGPAASHEAGGRANDLGARRGTQPGNRRSPDRRSGGGGRATGVTGLRGYRIVYPVQEKPLVSIIIPSKDRTELLKNTVDSILNKTNYTRFEIIVLNNNSTTKLPTICS